MNSLANIAPDKKLSLLLVEDDIIDQLAFKRFVEEEHLTFEYTLVASFERAQAILSSNTFDIVVCDYNLGDGTALDVLPLVGKTPLIVVTGAGSENVAVQAMKAGAYDYLVKDAKRNYLKMLPVTIDRILKQQWAEIQAHAFEQEKMRREALSDFLRSASHDLRTPLSNLNTSIYLMEKYTQVLLALLSENRLDLERVQKHTEKVLDRCNQLKTHQHNLEILITSMLELARIDLLDRLELVPQNLNDIAEQEVQKFAAVAKKHNIYLAFYPANQPVWCRIRIEDWSLLMKHLINNAIEFTPPGGEVIVQVSTDHHHALLDIIDTGIGIPESDLHNIFNPFYRVDQARQSKDGQGGLGLAITKRIAELHQGSIEVSSIVGQGSRFTVSLPLIP